MRPLPSLRSFVGRRLLTALLTAVVVSIAVFVLFEQLGDPAARQLGPLASPQQIAARRERLGLDGDALSRFVSAVSGLWGSESSTRLWAALPKTLAYALPGAAAGLSIALAGALAARRSRPLDLGVVVIATLALSVSAIVSVPLFAHFATVRLGWAPVRGWPGPSSDEGWLRYIIAPTIAWSVIFAAPELRYFRDVVAEQARSGSIESAQLRGLSPREIDGRLLRSSAGALLVRVGHRFPHAILGSAVIEQVFNIPGVGALALDAAATLDLRLTEHIALVLSLATVFAQLLTDLAAGAIDPRLRRWA